MTIDDATRRWIQGPHDEAAAAAGHYFDEERADHARRFFRRYLRHSAERFRGQPFELLEWQYQKVVGPLFGWRKPDGKRRFRTAYIEIPKKNGKSALCSGLSLYFLITEPGGAEVFLCASCRDQATIVYDEAANMVRASPDLNRHLEVLTGTHAIHFHKRGSKIRAIPADAGTAQGYKPTILIMDELHAWKGRDFYDAMIYATRPKLEPLTIAITTAGDQRAGVCWEQHEQARRVLAGEETIHSLLPLIYCDDPGDDWRDIRSWAKANPSLGHTIPIEAIEHDIAEAESIPSKRPELVRYGLNRWGESASNWLDPSLWAGAKEPYTWASLKGKRAWGGIDLSARYDLSAVVWLIETAPGRLAIWPRLYMPRDLARDHEASDKVPYRAWAEAGHLTLTDGDTIDYEWIESDVVRDAAALTAVSIGYDAWNAEPLCNHALRIRHGLPTVEVAQRAALISPAASQFELRLAKRNIVHPGNPLLNWMAGNVAVSSDKHGNIYPVKKKSTGRIDGIIAAIIALSRQMAEPGGRRWATPGFLPSSEE